jgi:predicted dehydrogenase
MTKSLNIGLVGSGFMGQAHTDAYRRAAMLYRNLPCIPVLYAIADQNDSLAEEARRKLGFCKAYGDWRRLIEDPYVHVVDITTPNHLHVDVALAALEAGKHVYCEKPMAVKVEDAQRMAAAADKAGVNTLVAFNNVKTPAALVASRSSIGAKSANQYASAGDLTKVFSTTRCCRGLGAVRETLRELER